LTKNNGKHYFSRNRCRAYKGGCAVSAKWLRTNLRKRKKKLTKQIALGYLKIGGKAPVVVQSMTKTDTRDVRSTISQIKKLEVAGCEVVRVAVLNEEAAQAIKSIKKKINIPLIADVHF